MIIQSLTIMLAYYIDLIIGDPSKWPHPVKFFGRYISFCERHFNKERLKRLSGLISIIILIVFVFFTTFYLLKYLYEINLFIGIFVEAVLIATTISGKGLKQAAMSVYQPLKEKNILMI